MPDIKLFIGSSGSSIGVADLIANRLEAKVKGLRTRVWDEGVFTMNRGVLERLLEIVDDYDFAVMVWGRTMSPRAKASRRLRRETTSSSNAGSSWEGWEGIGYSSFAMRRPQ